MGFVDFLGYAGTAVAGAGGYFAWQKARVAKQQSTELILQGEIERLQDRVGKLESRLDALGQTHKAEIDKLREEKHAANNVAQVAMLKVSALEAENSTLKAEITRLMIYLPPPPQTNP